METFVGIGNRLREERERLGFSQTDLAALAGASKNSQYNYEKGERSPDTAYLVAVAARGVDVLYVVTGERVPMKSDGLTVEEAELLLAYRVMSEADRLALSRVAGALAKSQNR